jgi:hypothetical protein
MVALAEARIKPLSGSDRSSPGSAAFTTSERRQRPNPGSKATFTEATWKLLAAQEPPEVSSSNAYEASLLARASTKKVRDSPSRSMRRRYIL